MFEGFRRKYDYSENPQKAHISGKTLRDTCIYLTEGESTEMVVPSRNVTWRAEKSLPYKVNHLHPTRRNQPRQVWSHWNFSRKAKHWSTVYFSNNDSLLQPQHASPTSPKCWQRNLPLVQVPVLPPFGTFQQISLGLARSKVASQWRHAISGTSSL